MTTFDIHLNNLRPGRIFVEVDRRLDVGIVRTKSGLSVEIYPRTDGQLWTEPFTTFEVDEAEIIALEKDMEA